MEKKGYKAMVRGIEGARIENVIREYVHNGRDREVLRLSLLDDVSYTRIADRAELEVSSRTVQEIMNKWMPIIMENL